MKISVFKELLRAKDVPYIVDLEKVLQRIKVGKSKDIVEQIRNGEKKLKNKLPCILFAGEFSERNGNGLITHSGLMVVDFDKYPNMETMMEHLEVLKENPHFITLFISPSGNGIKGVVKIPEATKETHPKYFKAFQKKFDYNYFDKVNSNVDRVCFESYDPNIYINYDAELFDAELIDEGFSVSEKTPLIPITDEDKIIERIMAFGWKKDFVEGERNAFIYDLAGMFCEYGVSQSYAEGYIFNNVIIGDFSESEMKTTIKSAYRKRSFGSKFFEDYTRIDKVRADLKKGKEEVIKKHGITEDTYDELKEAEEHDSFWSIDDKGKVKADTLKYKKFLERNGFKKHFANGSDKPTYVYINENKVEITSIARIKDFVLDFLLKNEEYEVWRYCANYQNLFSEQYLLFLETIDLVMLSDTATKSYIAYRNGILEVTKDSTQLFDYIDKDDSYIWKSHILDRDFEEVDDCTNDYSKFIHNISGGEPTAIECMLGYMISTYKSRSCTKAVILNDEVISDNPEGGTGKGLLTQGLSHIRTTSFVDGKGFDKKKDFAYQTVSLDTKILVLDDIVKNFNFEDKFSLVTEGITLERKNKDAIKLNIHDSPKLLLSTNYAVKGEGNSHNRRRHEIEISQYYGAKLTPHKDFGRELFDDWDDAEFNRFDNYMVKCLQLFLKMGLIEQNAKNIRLRKFIAETNMEFKEWVTDLPINEMLNKQVQFDVFVNEYPDYQRHLTRKRFNIWIQKYCSYMEYEYQEGTTNGVHWFVLKK